MKPNKLYKLKEDPFEVADNEEEWQKADLILDLLMKHCPSSIIDIGCGEGIFSNYYYNQIRPNEFYCCDISSIAVRRTRKLMKLGNKCFVYDITNEEPDKKLQNKFDLIILSEVLYYLPPDKLEKAIYNIQLLNKKEGQLIICNSQCLSIENILYLIEPYYSIAHYATHDIIEDKLTLLLDCRKKSQ